MSFAVMQDISSAWIKPFLGSILHLRKNSKQYKPKVYYIDARHQFYIKSPSLALRPRLYFRKNFKRCNEFSKHLPYTMAVNVSIFYETSGVIPSIIYCSNTRHPFCMNKALLVLRVISHFRENSKWTRRECIFP